MKMLLTVFLIVFSLCQAAGSKNYDHGVWNMHQNQMKNMDRYTTIEKVHVVFMNHLDVGYDGIYPVIGFINNVVNTYFHSHFPQAWKLANDMRAGGYVEGFRYTTHPWLISMYLDCPPNLWLAGVQLKCPNATDLGNFTEAIKRGDIVWHSGPMNMQIENIHDPLLMEFGLTLAKDLDKRFNITRKFPTLSQRDVPGMTQAVIPTLVKMGIGAISVGVNNMTPPPAVPSGVYVWKYAPTGQEVLATTHPGGYPDNAGPNPNNPGGLSRKDCVLIDGFAETLCFAFRTDNSGPPQSVTELLGYYEILRKEFPDAEFVASTLEEYFAAVNPIRSKLPVVTSEIGDNWIQGTASDPRKMAEYRSAVRVLNKCFTAGKCSWSDIRVYNASRFLIKLPEHTWGLNAVADSVNWTNAAFYKAQEDPSVSATFRNCTLSWLEQRNITYIAIDALRDHPVVPLMKAELAQLTPAEPDLEGYTQISPVTNQTFTCADGIEIGFEMDGSIATLNYKGVSWASPLNPLSLFMYVSYNETDFQTMGNLYDYKPGISPGLGKPNATLNARPESRSWPVTLMELYKKQGEGCQFQAHVEPVEVRSWTYYGAPREIWLTYTVRNAAIDITLQWFDKTSTRLAEALYLAFTPTAQPGHKWFLSKQGQLVDPLNIILNGSQHQHDVDERGVMYVDPSSGAGLEIGSADVALACINNAHLPTVFPVPLTPPNQTEGGVAFNFYNNIWFTNYIFWYPYIPEDKDFKARFTLNFWSKSSEEAGKIREAVAHNLKKGN